jgi:hypothetical protein
VFQFSLPVPHNLPHVAVTPSVAAAPLEASVNIAKLTCILKCLSAPPHRHTGSGVGVLKDTNILESALNISLGTMLHPALIAMNHNIALLP